MSIPVSLQAKRVFVVDDEVNIADTLSLILRGVGFTVCTFYDGMTALKYAQQENPDFVLSDVVMPNMDGFTLAAKLHEQLPRCRVLLISGNAGYTTLSPEWEEQGGPELEILSKPVGPQIIIRKLTEMALAAEANNDPGDRGTPTP